ncbi:hypothetical protein AAG906_039573 [Vitis piasezkii]
MESEGDRKKSGSKVDPRGGWNVHEDSHEIQQISLEIPNSNLLCLLQSVQIWLGICGRKTKEEEEIISTSCIKSKPCIPLISLNSFQRSKQMKLWVPRYIFKASYIGARVIDGPIYVEYGEKMWADFDARWRLS